jgi:signal transduction histidine kinase
MVTLRSFGAASRRLLQPSLARRVVAALLLAFALVWCVLIALDFWAFRQDTRDNPALRGAVQALADALAQTSAAEAVAIVRASELQFNRSRRASGLDGVGDLVLGLSRRDGTPLYGPAELEAALADRARHEPHRATLRGKTYRAEVVQTPMWRVTMLEPEVDDALLLRWLGSEQWLPMLVAFPLVLVPVWLAVRRGLAPLRMLVARASQCEPAAGLPLGLNLRQAELRPLEQAFDQLLVRAGQGMARERAFVQDAAHELRTPLAVLGAQAHALVGATDAGQQRAAQAALNRAVERASHLVHQLLTLARVESGARLVVREHDLIEAARQIMIAAAPLAQARQIDIALESPPQLQARVNLEHFHSILDNLLRNALTYCPPGACVEVHLCMQGPGVRLRVIDDGPGIAAAERERLFERFQRGRGEQAPGAGLGLAIVRAAAAAIGATVVATEGIGGRGVGFVVDIAQR